MTPLVCVFGRDPGPGSGVALEGRQWGSGWGPGSPCGWALVRSVCRTWMGRCGGGVRVRARLLSGILYRAGFRGFLQQILYYLFRRSGGHGYLELVGCL